MNLLWLWSDRLQAMDDLSDLFSLVYRELNSVPPPPLLPTLCIFSLWLLQASLLYDSVQAQTPIIRRCRRCLAMISSSATIWYYLANPVRPATRTTSLLALPFGMFLLTMAIKLLDWGYTARPVLYVGLDDAIKESDGKEDVKGGLLARAKWTMKLFCTQRGIGWNFGPPVASQRSMPPNDSMFVARVVHAIVIRVIVGLPFTVIAAVSMFSDAGQLYGPSWIYVIYENLSNGTYTGPLVRMLAVISLVVQQVCYSDAGMLLLSLLGYTIDRIVPFDARLYPPMFPNSPWRATSIASLWSYHWHDQFRTPLRFVYLTATKATPGPKRFKRFVAVFAAMGVSGLWLHDIPFQLATSYKPFDWRLGFTTFFLWHAAAIAAEDVYRAITGRKVGGKLGWLWTMTICYITGHHARAYLLDAYKA
ncbi:uncharacterized protein L969DRAFT_59374 [Mixia osmundae IAM 14324]|uniref:Wax synthase domain-containing protein n=1 Tax=Mixia osmundae (strain CBS 9802 / IAM 14324 / JCM 22182 / KY 12970) TaxID=764103 RepID=G7E605_MIXOS|nr:uncharacterized protein L969DRAFT_59374 [Mixia osmundae IAM 14324]KEI40587.1 hypothetical protein L969DRAFT_59374 [Mixia osmundae IAM 14324]GAA98265.1 hypothetical protein E5Q_04948 [Mixia osmundae IAM 14324]